tara:strand:- start:5200 stop:6381 length:1182 start_codon:yes stop_codon:yes gene_type:complete
MTEDMLEKVAKTVGVSPDTLREKAEEVFEAQSAAWLNAGKTGEEASVLALRVAARQIANEQAKLRRSGATLYEGMFVHVPKAKEWGKILYNKMQGQLANATDEVKNTLIENGSIVIFEDNHDGSFTRYAREDFFGASESEVSDLPRTTQKLDESTHYYIVWDSNNPTFPSGDKNFKYGAARPHDERERTSLFFGRPQGSNGEWSPILIKGSSNSADMQFPTFTTGTIGVRPSRDGATGYLTRVSEFTEDENLTSMFSSPPLELMQEFLPDDFLPALTNLGEYYDNYYGKDGWWDRICGVVAEIIHIDPRDNGGFIMVCSDPDIMSMAEPLDVYVPASQSHLVDFAVGTKVLLTGQVWRTREGDDRMSVNGWWAFDKIAPIVASPDVEGEGWDA